MAFSFTLRNTRQRFPIPFQRINPAEAAPSILPVRYVAFTTSPHRDANPQNWGLGFAGGAARAAYLLLLSLPPIHPINPLFHLLPFSTLTLLSLTPFPQFLASKMAALLSPFIQVRKQRFFISTCHASYPTLHQLKSPPFHHSSYAFFNTLQLFIFDLLLYTLLFSSLFSLLCAPLFSHCVYLLFVSIDIVPLFPSSWDLRVLANNQFSGNPIFQDTSPSFVE